MANATSNATAARGALAQAQSTAIGSSGQAHSTAKTTFVSVGVQSSAVAPTGGTATTDAIAQGGSGQAFANPGETAYAFSTASANTAYAASLIGGASNAASALLGPRDAVFGTAILGANYAADGGGESNTYSASSTLFFGYFDYKLSSVVTTGFVAADLMRLRCPALRIEDKLDHDGLFFQLKGPGLSHGAEAHVQRCMRATD